MKATFLLVLVAILSTLHAEASVAPAKITTDYSVTTLSANDNAADWGLFKRKKYKYKKRRSAHKSRYRRGGLFSR